MRILYFHQHFSTPSGSTGTRSYETARRLVARGHSVTMVCGSYGGANSGLSSPFVNGMRRGQVDGIDVIELHLPYSNYDSLVKRSRIFAKFALKSIRIALGTRYDLIFATSTPLTAGIPGIAASLLLRRHFVFEVRDLWPELPRAMGVVKNPVVLWAMGALEWLSYHTSVGCVGLSPGIVEGITRRGVRNDDLVMVPNGCDLDTFDPSVGPRLRPKGTSPSDFVAVFSGAHGLANGLDAVLDAAALLKERGRSDIKLVFIGDGKLKPRLKKRAEEQGLGNSLFLDPVPKTQLNGLLRGVDAGLMVLANVPAFYFGTSPNKFFDYIAAGLPVLNNYPGWLAGLIGQNDCGIAVEPGNAAAFADALERMADDRAVTARMGRNARLLAERQFGRGLLTDRLVDFLERCAAR